MMEKLIVIRRWGIMGRLKVIRRAASLRKKIRKCISE
jgi:hypothetical protein